MKDRTMLFRWLLVCLLGLLMLTTTIDNGSIYYNKNPIVLVELGVIWIQSDNPRFDP